MSSLKKEGRVSAAEAVYLSQSFQLLTPNNTDSSCLVCVKPRRFPRELVLIKSRPKKEDMSSLARIHISPLKVTKAAICTLSLNHKFREHCNGRGKRMSCLQVGLFTLNLKYAFKHIPQTLKILMSPTFLTFLSKLLYFLKH